MVGYADHTDGADAASPTETVSLIYQSIAEATSAAVAAPTAPAGDVTGFITVPGQTPVPIVTHDWSVSVPFDPASGLVSGKASAKDFVFTDVLGSTAPVMRAALSSNTVWSSVTVELRQPGAASGYATYLLASAIVSSVVDSGDGSSGGSPMEEVHLAYHQLQLSSGGQSSCVFSLITC